MMGMMLVLIGILLQWGANVLAQSTAFLGGVPLRLPAPCPSDLVSGYGTWQQSCCPANSTYVKEERAVCCPDGLCKIQEICYSKS